MIDALILEAIRRGIPTPARLTADLLTDTAPTPSDVAHLGAIDPGRSTTKGETPFASHVTPGVPA